MNARISPQNRQRGATLIFALLILAVGAMVLAGSVAVSGAMVQHTLSAQTAVTRRLTLENSRTLAVQYVREQLLQNSGTAGVSQSSVTSGGYALGGVTIAAPGSSVWASTTAPVGPNPFSPAGDTRVTSGANTYYYSGFTRTMSGTLSAGSTTVPWSFEVRSRTPTLGYDLVTFYTGSTSGISSANSIAYANGPYLSGNLLNGAFPPNIVPSDYVSSASSESGRINVFATLTSTVSAADYRVETGTVTLYLTSTVNTPHTYVLSGTPRHVIFANNPTGPVAPGYPLRLILSSTIAASSTVTISATSRQIYLVNNSPHSVTINHSNTPQLTAVLMSGGATIQNGTIRGGLIRSGGTLTISGTGLAVVRETAPGNLDQMAYRRGWVETYRND